MSVYSATESSLAAALISHTDSDLRQFADGIPIATFAIDTHHRITLWNRALERLSGLTATRMVGSTDQWRPFYGSARPVLADLLIDDEIDERIGDFYGGKFVPSHLIPGAFEVEDFFPDLGPGTWLHFTVAPLYAPDGTLRGAVELLQDVTARHAAENAARLFQRAVECSADAVMIASASEADHPILYVNPAFTSVTGYSSGEAIGRNGRFLVADNTDPQQMETVRHALRQHGHAVVEVESRRQDGSPYWCRLSTTPVRDDRGSITHSVTLLHDISEQKHYQQELEHKAHFDTLTGLANRNLLHDRLAQWINQRAEHGGSFATVYLDLDRFKLINDSLGHAAGDAVLQEVARRLKAQGHPDETIARLSGDEFVLLLSLPDHRPPEQTLAPRLEALGKDIARPISVQDTVTHSQCSMGVAIYPRDGDTPATLLKAADLAMYRAKELGRNGFQFFDRTLNAAAADRLAMENDLSRALANEEFELYFQPQICARTGALVSAEALIRWHHPQRGLLLPGTFIPVAEDSGQIVGIGEWVIHAACREHHRWRDAGFGHLGVGINVAAQQFWKSDLRQIIRNAAGRHDLSSFSLDVELTESMIMHDPQAAQDTLTALRDSGIRISLDDFGTGYSSLSCLRHFPFHTLKIDQSFVRDIETDTTAREIVRSIIRMAQALHLETVAEGVETAGQVALLREAGCDILQGYYFARPLPAAAFLEFASRHSFPQEAAQMSAKPME